MRYRPATIGDAEMLLSWRNDKLTVANNRNSRPVSREEHAKWFSARQGNPDRFVFIVLDEDIPIGTVRLDRMEHKENGWETGVTIAPTARGHGYGGKALKLVCDDFPEATLYTEVKFDNAASMKSFAAAGFVQIGSSGPWTQHRRLPLK